MKLLNGEIFGAVEPLMEIAKKELPVKVSWALAKLSNKLAESHRAIETVRNGLIQRYGEKDKENPNNVLIKPESENFPKFVKDAEELFLQEVEIDFEKIKLPEEVDGKPLTLKPSLLAPLVKFIEIGD